MRHKEYQDGNLEMKRRIAGLPKNATMFDIIIALVDMKEFAEAVELLFGSERNPPLTSDKLGFAIYMQLWSGHYPDMIKKIAGAHHWNTDAVDIKRQRGGFQIGVYPNEIFVIEEPVASMLLTPICRDIII